MQSYISDKESFSQLLMDSSVCGAKGGLILTEETIDSLEALEDNISEIGERRKTTRGLEISKCHTNI